MNEIVACFKEILTQSNFKIEDPNDVAIVDYIKERLELNVSENTVLHLMNLYVEIIWQSKDKLDQTYLKYFEISGKHCNALNNKKISQDVKLNILDLIK